jgi:glycopeptide antibiotics resistance protein
VIFMVFRWIRIRTLHAMSGPRLALSLLLLWGLFIAYATMLPFDFSAANELIRSRIHRLWERPLRGGGGSLHDVYSNVLLFMPWGFLLAIWRAGRGSTGLAALAWALLSGACLSAFVEFVQLFAPKRSTSFIDLATNTFGSFIGAMIGWSVAKWIWPFASVRIRRLLRARPLVVCTLAVLVGLLVTGLRPTYVKQEGHPSTANLKRLNSMRLLPFRMSPSERMHEAALRWGAETLAWVLFGGLLALTARESGRDGIRTIGCAAAFAGCVSLFLEIMQIVVPGRNADATSVVLAVVGSYLGALIVMRSAKRDPSRWIVPALAIWGAATMLDAWSPFRFAWFQPPFWRTAMLVPFWSYFDSRNLEDLTDVVGQAMTFAPLGALLAARSWKQTFLGTVLLGFGLAELLEFGQVLLPDRSADMSDAISAAAGAGLGLALWRWGESVRNSAIGATRYRVGTLAGR